MDLSSLFSMHGEPGAVVHLGHAQPRPLGKDARRRSCIQIGRNRSRKQPRALRAPRDGPFKGRSRYWRSNRR